MDNPKEFEKVNTNDINLIAKEPVEDVDSEETIEDDDIAKKTAEGKEIPNEMKTAWDPGIGTSDCTATGILDKIEILDKIVILDKIRILDNIRIAVE